MQNLDDSAVLPLPVLQELDDGILLVDSSGRIIYTNPAAQQLIGKSHPLSEAPFHVLVRLVDEQTYAAIDLPDLALEAENRTARSKTEVTGLLLGHNGSRQPVRLVISPFEPSHDSLWAWCVTLKIQKHILYIRSLHMQKILLAIGRANDLIAREKDRDRLLSAICRIITESLDFHQAWIILTEDSKPVPPFYHAGNGDNFEQMVERLTTCRLAQCDAKALLGDGMQILDNPALHCRDCPLAMNYEGRSAFSMQLAFRERVYGWMSISVPNTLARDREAQAFFADFCRNISKALWSIETAEQNKTLEQRYTAIIESSTDAVISCDLTGRITLFSPGAEALFECPSAEAIGCNISTFCPPEKQSEQKRMLEQVIMLGQPARFISERRSISGRTCIVEVLLNAQLGEDGSPTGINGIIRDMTERIQMEQALRESETRFRRIVQILPQLICYIDRDYRIRDANRPNLSIEGRRFNIINKPVPVILGTTTFADIQGYLDKAFLGERVHYRDEIRSQSGRTYNVDSWLIPDIGSDGLQRGVYAVIHDITQIKETRQALLLSTNKTRAILRAAPVGIGVTINRKFFEVNEKFCEITGYSQEELIGQNSRIIYPSDAEYAYVGTEKYRQIKAQGTGQVETKILRKDGRLVDILMASTPLDKNDLRQGVTFTALDITTRKKVETDLREQQRAITLTNRIAKVFLTASVENIFRDVLQVLLQTLQSQHGYFGYLDEKGDLVCPAMTTEVWAENRPIEDQQTVTSADQRGILLESINRKQTILVNESLRLGSGHIELECALAAPIIHHSQVIGQFVVANKAGGYSRQDKLLIESGAAQTAPILFSYLEEQKRQAEHEVLEAQYRQAQKLESIGRLAGGVAHDLNNLLSPILGYAEILREDLSEDYPLRDSADQIVKAGQRAADLVRQLLAFSRKQSLEFKPVDLNILLKNFEKLLRRTIREDIQLILETSADLPQIHGDIGQLEQVIMNLAVNAQDAMKNGGKLCFRTSTVHLANAGIVDFEEMQDGIYVSLTIIDNGIGMDEETRARIFEPFFTTKDLHEGTGLGLATVYGIIKQHNGSITVESSPDNGTTFTILLPAAPEILPGPEQTEEVPNSPGGDETILLVEDNSMMRRLARTILERKGYTVLTAKSGNEALQFASTYKGTINLLLTDVIMPGLNGKELFDILSRIRPGLKVLFMSGYTGNVIMTEDITESPEEFIEKPFSVSALTEKIRLVLADRNFTH